jgi:ketosteroid isomerase-like protein
MALVVALLAGLLVVAESQVFGSDASSIPLNHHDKFITPNLNHLNRGNEPAALSHHKSPAEHGPGMDSIQYLDVKGGNGEKASSTMDDRFFTSLRDKPVHPTEQAHKSTGFMATRVESLMSTKDVDLPKVANKESEKNAVQKLFANGNNTPIKLSAIGVGLLTLVAMLGVSIRRAMQPATVLASSSPLASDMSINMAPGLGDNIMEMESQGSQGSISWTWRWNHEDEIMQPGTVLASSGALRSDMMFINMAGLGDDIMEMQSHGSGINGSAAFETRHPCKETSSRVGWGQLSSQSPPPLTLCHVTPGKQTDSFGFFDPLGYATPPGRLNAVAEASAAFESGAMAPTVPVPPPVGSAEGLLDGYNNIRMMTMDCGDEGTAAQQVRAYFAAWNERDMEAAVQKWAEDCKYEDTQYAGAFEGKEALRAHLIRVADELPRSFTFIVDEVADGGSTVGVQWHVESNGEPLPFTRGCSVYTTNADGLLATGFDVPEPAPIKPGGAGLALLSLASKIIDEPLRTVPLLCLMVSCPQLILADGHLQEALYAYNGAANHVQDALHAVGKGYASLLDAHPLATKSIQNTLVCLAGDAISQHGQAYDAKRAARYGLKGLGGGFLWSFYFDFADAFAVHAFDGAAAQVATQIALEGLVWVPLYVAFYDLPFASVLNGVPLRRVPGVVRESLPPTVLASAKLWTPANLLVYNSPLEFRLLVSNVFDLAWNSVNSNISASCSEDGCFVSEAPDALASAPRPGGGGGLRPLVQKDLDFAN